MTSSILKYRNKIYILVLLTFSIIINQYYGNRGTFPMDSFHFFDSGYRILNGSIPLVDYWLFKGPLLDYISAIFFYLFGVNWQAYVFQAWNTQRAFNKRPPVGNIIQRAFNKIGEILTKTKRFLQGKGYNTWESVFKLAGEGKVGRRGFDFKTKEEAEAFGKKRAEEPEEAKDVPTRTDVDFEEAKDRKLVDALDVGERVITPADAQYSVERTTNYPPTSSELKKPINSNNSIFKPLGFRPSQDAINTLNDSAKKYIEAKQSKKKGLERQRLLSEADKLSTDFKNKLVSEKPERVKEAVIKEMMQPMVNSAVAENQGHKFNIKDPDTDESITIGRGSELVGEDAKIHKDLSNKRYCISC